MKKILFLLFMLSILPVRMWGQSCVPKASYTTCEGEEIDDASTSQDAPLKAKFTANPEDLWGYNARYEWKIWDADDPNTILVHRFEQDMEYTFKKSGSFQVQLYATFTLDGDTISWPEEGEENPFTVVISSSKLEMPNAFSPNGDEWNNVYNAKPGYQSIVDFKATIFNRWGQKLYSWTNPDRNQDGWDGTYHGKKVKDGVYFVVVSAKGADGRIYKIKKDVNLLTGYDNGTQNGGTDE